MYDELTSGDAVVDLSPSQALSRAESFLIGQGYVVAHRTLTTLMAERKGSEGLPGKGRGFRRWWSWPCPNPMEG